ncbi:Stp1/IreP family PP2C-type Ser/Thr phosphatase [uncultured Methanomethylovorans sp.]|uniref:Stp1/IreP family PP2C-type Ser/Thr phosphatase n=1 Tax=uncultured Methanomethylovorans sp. TaxID=183759 RepID=UPI002AA788CD|nr:Stp1/IreP family PP2C-type Ser/Thr phosphatase [uncultured Methanomethylovorans sp.]
MLYSSATHQGSRSNNEDFFGIATIENDLLLIIADGLGGHNAGEVASKLAVDVVLRTIKDLWEDTSHPLEKLSISFRKANDEIITLSKNNPSFAGMGTTIVIALVMGKSIFLANVGDSRAYIVTNNSIEQITKDHSFVQSLVDIGAIDKEEAFTHSQKNIVLQSLGSKESIKPDFYEIEMKNDDLLLLCTDGLSDVLKDSEILEVCHDSCTRDIVPNMLVNAVLKKGAKDNITVVCYWQDI